MIEKENRRKMILKRAGKVKREKARIERGRERTEKSRVVEYHYIPPCLALRHSGALQKRSLNKNKGKTKKQQKVGDQFQNRNSKSHFVSPNMTAYKSSLLAVVLSRLSAEAAEGSVVGCGDRLAGINTLPVIIFSLKASSISLNAVASSLGSGSVGSVAICVVCLAAGIWASLSGCRVMSGWIGGGLYG